MSREIEVWADWRELGAPMRMGHLRSTPSRGKEVFSFSYEQAWLDAGPFEDEKQVENAKIKFHVH